MRNDHLLGGVLFIVICVGIGLVIAMIGNRSEPLAASLPIGQASHVNRITVPPPAVMETAASVQPPEAATTEARASFDLTSGDGRIFSASTNPHGGVMIGDDQTIYLGIDCDARSNSGDRGEWRWANGGFVIHLGGRDIGFARQEPPVPEAADISACAM